MQNIFIALLSVLLLSSCATSVSSIKSDATNVENAKSLNDRGYLLIGVETNRSLKNIFIIGEENIKLSHEDLRMGTNYILIDLAAGDYLISNIALNDYQKLLLDDKDNWRFEIKPKTISYIGHLELASRGFFNRGIRIELVNRSTEALEFMEDNFPTILSAQEMHFGGPSEDYFFRYLNGEVSFDEK